MIGFLEYQRIRTLSCASLLWEERRPRPTSKELTISHQCVKKCQSKPCSKSDREHNFDVIL